MLGMASITFGSRSLAQAPGQPDHQIRLETQPTEVRAGEEFELIWRMSAVDAHVLEAAADITDAFGPEHTWKPNAQGEFIARTKHKEAEAGYKEYSFWAKLKEGERTRFVGETFQVQITPAGGDQELQDFLAWMKQAGYSEEIIKIHAHDGTRPKVRKEWGRYFEKRKQEMAYRDMETMHVLFIDVMGEDAEAINKPLENEIHQLEAYLAHMYGKAFKVDYEQLKVPYATQFGKPVIQKNAKGHEWLKFNPLPFNTFARETAQRISEERDLPNNGVILRWAVKRWKDGDRVLSIQDHTGSGPAFSGYDFNGYGLGIYAHEWGHGLGLGHMFVNGSGSFSSRIWGLDCIMNHSYVPYANKEVGRLLSPLLRYVLEPKDGYTDQDQFAAEYNESMAGTELLKERLKETEQQASVDSTMAWSTPWQAGMSDSMIVEGLKNHSYILRDLKVLPDLKPGNYMMVVNTRGPNKQPTELVIQQDGEVVASGPIQWTARVPQTVTIDGHLSFTIASNRGAGNLYGIGKLLNERRLVIEEP